MWTDRHGGVSAAPYASLDLGTHVGDHPDRVARNRGRVADLLGLPGPETWRFLDQIHGDGVVTVRGPVTDAPPAADAAVTGVVGLVLVVLTADCAPVVIADDAAVGVVHVGWRGLAGGVVARAVAALRAIGSGPVRAAVGPCIRAPHYEFGPSDLAVLVDRFGPSVAGRTGSGAPALDVVAGLRVALAECGVDDLDDVGVCTAADPDYFSYRRDGRTGRQGLVAWIDR